MKITSIEDLKRIKEEAQKNTLLREGTADIKIVVCMGTCGIAAGARQVMSSLLDEVSKRNLKNVIITQAGCIGLCDREPLISVEKGGEKVYYGDLSPDKARQIISSHVVNGQIIGEWVVHTER
ncbi:(2Fe-2S) ferredoxin domain-containing protein [Atribacter laminatus]|jgi:(2Fe-2S) ferredoxin|uniref:NADP-reducing hydrogenase subunit HndB n=1 Tax=Atribacter laminatus TaxID=2847778 RepID=A0A7T1F486_ATRLM|nr:(2Fe-2S) ferredoxin domain-containing protein [Atribacter laminatus]QPM69510.1 NADP-reducing hydrogenase subunit HndB [Atribacter laminatus]